MACAARLDSGAVLGKLQVHRVETLRQYMEHIEDLMEARVPLWYRGAGVSSQPMVPSLYRHPTITSAGELMALERRILQRFRERSVPYQPVAGMRETDWELLFLMQHFGVPTRLLDWTENPYIGLFFALTSAPFDYATNAGHDDACVWVLRPAEWNAQALVDISYAWLDPRVKVN